MSLFIVLAALGALMYIAWRGGSVILFAPLAALAAVLLTDPMRVAPMFTLVFMEKLAGFLKLYFPVFLLGALFGKVIELSGFSRSLVSLFIRLAGPRHAMAAIVLVAALLTYGGVSLFVVVFAVYPFGAGLFRQAAIPKRLLPATIALGAFTFTMDALPGTPQIQNLIPAPVFGTTIYAAPWLGVIGSLFIFVSGLAWLESRRRRAAAASEGYGLTPRNEPEPADESSIPHPAIALLPLLAVAAANQFFTRLIPNLYGTEYHYTPPAGGGAGSVQTISQVTAIWSIEGALLLGIALVLALAWRPVVSRFTEGARMAVAGALLAAMNTASEYGFGAVIAALPGFSTVAAGLQSIRHPLLREAVTVTSLAGITGSASGGLSLALGAMGDALKQAAAAAQISPEVLHRVAAMASGGMDTLPHNGAVITLLAVTGLTHREAYRDIFTITLLKTVAVFLVIAVHMATGLV